jgi:hypothetical protein
VAGRLANTSINRAASPGSLSRRTT